jgi:hypothetical protein
MTLIIRGKTVCKICGRTLLDGEEVDGFPPFVPNQADPLAFFNDAAFHSVCFQQHPLSQAAEARFQECREKGSSGNRTCAICGRVIQNPDDYLGFGHLTDDPSQPAHALDYLKVHRSCLATWTDLGKTREALLKLSESGAWKGPGLDWLIEQLYGTNK